MKEITFEDLDKIKDTVLEICKEQKIDSPDVILMSVIQGQIRHLMEKHNELVRYINDQKV